ncbi:MAG: hypothetical protein JWP11_3114 [Frankiales bacterium]|nr:hypothetical protein [Frankiales bacterium]
MLTVLSILGVLAVLFVAAAVATREGPILADAPVDIADVELPEGPLQPEDLRAVRFALAVRGYRMDEVDRVIERAAAALAERDERILALEKGRSGPVSVAPAAATVVLATPTGPAQPEPVAAGGSAAPETPSEPSGPAEPLAPIEPPLDTPPPPPAPPAEPEATEPEASEPEASEPEASGPAATGPEATGPEATGPEATEPEATEPETTEPEVAETASEALPPPPAPPVQVAVVRTEVAPLPTSTSVPPGDEGTPTAD